MFYILWDGILLVCQQKMLQNNLDSKEWTENNIDVMKSQLKKLGLSIDWDREISTFSRILQASTKTFLELYDKGLVYRKESYVNWDPVDKTVLK